jgi:hypothetical protein
MPRIRIRIGMAVGTRADGFATPIHCLSFPHYPSIRPRVDQSRFQ